ncbi:MAG: hypothetical protein ACI9VR_003773, partial [Cognaticolwellia sp.]
SSLSTPIYRYRFLSSLRSELFPHGKYSSPIW